MITKIGIVAGEIWHFLDYNGEVDLEELIRGIKRSREIILMSLGWLAREGHVLLVRNDKSYKVALRQVSSQL